MGMHVNAYLGVGLIAVCAAIALWDLWAVSAGHPAETVSEVFKSFGARNLWLPFALGFVAGHLWW